MGNSIDYNARKKKQQRNIKLKQQALILKSQLYQKLQIKNQFRKQILSSSASQLVKLLNQFKITSFQLVIILGQQATRVNQQLNFITQENFQQAITLALQCDKYRKQTNKKNWTLGQKWDLQTYLPPLYGIPITVKDYIKMKGFASFFGLKGRAYQIQPQDGSIIQCMKNGGMIPIYRTNMPQLGMSCQTTNQMWGKTLNPWDKTKSPGGSSGGQSSAISSKSSVIGIATDTAGSLRNPAQFCGLFSLKCARGKIPNDGIIHPVISLYANHNINSSIGTITRSVDDIALWMKTATFEQFYKGKHDLYTNIYPFDEKLYIKYQSTKLKIGVLKELSLSQPTQASKRAVEQVVQKLEKKGYEVVQINIPNQKQILSSFLQQAGAQGNLKSYRKAMKGQPFIKEYKKVDQSTGLLFKTLFKIALLTGLFASQRQKWFIKNIQPKETIHDYLEHSGKLEIYKKQWIQYLRSMKIDLVVSPGFGSQAMPLGSQGQILMVAAIYSFIWNILDMAVGQMPITVVKQNERQYKTKYNDNFAKCLKQIAQESVGIPLGVQIVGFPFEQQKVLGLMKVLEKQIKFYENHPLPQL